MKLIYLSSDATGPWIIRTPMIAWALCADGEIRPVTPAGLEDGVSEPELGWWVESPDGTFHAAGGAFDVSRADTEQELLDWVRQYIGPSEDKQTAEEAK